MNWITERPIAHRGLHALPARPENSLAAFRAALERGYPIELDVQLLRDGAVAVFHDSKLQRLTAATGSIGEIDTAALHTLQLLGTDEGIPLLGEVLNLVQGRVPLLIELKQASPVVGALEQAVLRELEGYDGAYALQSFNRASLDYLQARRGDLSLGWLVVHHTTASHPFQFLACAIEAIPDEGAPRGPAPLLVWTVRDTAAQQKAEVVADNYIFEDLLP